ncbi:MAG: DUF4331 family protein [Candidatus Eisenbacteria bacterium]
MLRHFTGTILAAALLAGFAPVNALASSHSEAPGTTKDRLADDTDVYAWVAPDAPHSVTFVGDWVPMLEPNGGPNFFGFDDEASYYINVDNVGDALDHIRYQFRFRTVRRTGATFLYNTGQVTSLDDTDLNVRQFCTITRYDNGVATELANDVMVAPNYVGPVSMPDYASLAASAVRVLPDGSKLFIGPRDDPFFVDLAAIFDLLTIRKVPGNQGKGVDGLGGFNVLSIVLQVPKTRLTADGLAPSNSNSVIGIYNSVERQATRTLNGDGTASVSGAPIQVSRLGMPLVNEVVIALADKDRFNATKPTGDGAFLGYVTNPELAGLLTALYGIPTPPAPRNDLVAVFLTGIPGLNKPANPAQVACEMLRLNMAIAPAETPSRFGLLGGDIAGFPNGRRLFDDVVDIAERVVAGATPFTPAFNVAPNNQLGDGVDYNDRPFMSQFPYVALPHNPLNHEHHLKQRGGKDYAAPGNAKGAGYDDTSLESANREAAPVLGAGAIDASGQATAAPLARGLRVAGANPSSISRLEFTVPRGGRATLKVFDLQGRTVRSLFDQDAAAGTFAATWDGRLDDGARAGRGVYFARLTTGGETFDKKIVLE